MTPVPRQVPAVPCGLSPAARHGHWDAVVLQQGRTRCCSANPAVFIASRCRSCARHVPLVPMGVGQSSGTGGRMRV